MAEDRGAERRVDPEGEALEREIEADRRELRDRRMRRVLFLPPLLALTVAAWALGASRPREVFAARVYLAALPAAKKLTFRVEVVSAIPGLEGTIPTPNLELRLREAAGQVSKTDENGVAEASVTLDGKSSTEIDANRNGSWQSIGTLRLDQLLPRDERDGASKLRRSGGAKAGALRVDAWPEGSVLAPTHPGAIWVRVLDSASAPVAGATVTISADAGLSADPAPASTDASGLARLAVASSAPPVLLTANVNYAGNEGKWHGVIGAVVGVPVPVGSGFVKTDNRIVDLVGSPSWTTAYWDLFQAGARVGGGRVPMTNGHALVKLPDDVTGAADLIATSSAVHPSEDDLVHACTFPLVIEKDAVDAFGVVTSSPRFEDKLAKSPLGSYESVVAASIAAAPPAIPKLRLALDGLGEATRRELARGQTVRHAASAAIVGGGLLELGLMIALGVVGRKRTIADELADLEDESPQKQAPSSPWTARVLAIVVSSLGLVVLVFAALAVMAWGLK
ncbi:MAG: hypothetical protein ACXVEE_29605 [Polyangiales bacterium]